MRPARSLWRASLLSLALVAAAGACTSSGGVVNPSSTPSTGGSSPPITTSPPNGSPYASAVRTATSLGLHVWLEGDLAARWLQGPRSFRRGVKQLGQLASLPGVQGIKIADELGYQDGFHNDFSRIMSFLRDSATALHRAAPGKLLLIEPRRQRSDDEQSPDRTQQLEVSSGAARQ